MKTTILRKALAAILLLCATGPIHGQEMIRDVVGLHDDYSLVRETDRGKWLVYNYNFGRSIFSLITDTTTMAPQMYMNPPEGFSALKILDFEIFQDTVYFCGLAYYDLDEDYVTAWGYFPLQRFPHDTVFIEAGLYYMHYFNKLAVFSVDSSMSGLHILMTCNEPTFSDFNSIVDMVRITPNSFNSYTHNYDDDFKYYDDIEVTDNNVVFTFTETLGFGLFSWTYLYYVKKTSIPGITIFSNTVHRQRLSNYITEGRSLLEYCTDDVFVVAQPTHDSIRVFAFALTVNGNYGLLGGVRFFRSFYYQKMNDIKYDKQSKILDVLTEDNYLNSSKIYHLNPMLLGSGGTVYVHQLNGDLLNSLDVLRSNPDYFIASGHTSDLSNLRLFRYRYYDNNIECSEYFDLMADKTEYFEKPVEIYDEIHGFKIILDPLKTFPLENYVKTTCGKK